MIKEKWSFRQYPETTKLQDVIYNKNTIKNLKVIKNEEFSENEDKIWDLSFDIKIDGEDFYCEGDYGFVKSVITLFKEDVIHDKIYLNETDTDYDDYANFAEELIKKGKKGFFSKFFSSFKSTKESNHIKMFEEFKEGEEISEENEKPDFEKLKEDIKKFMNEKYTKEFFDQELFNRVYDYVGQDDLVGEGTEEEPEFDDEIKYYKEHAMGGAIEYDILGEMSDEITEKFNITDKTKDEIELLDMTNDHLMNNCDWYDTFVFQKSTEEYKSPSERFFGKGLDTSSWDL
jgi:hypothetical protein